MKASNSKRMFPDTTGILKPFVIALVAVVYSAPALAGVPTDQVRGTVNQVLGVLRDPQLKSAEKQKERKEKLNKSISARFDFAEMARRSLGAEWRRITPAQQQEFVELFSDLLRNAYAGNIESYKGEEVSYVRETREEQYAVVETILRSPEGTQYTIDYRLHLLESEWKAYDVVIENVSMVNNYRAQFARVINRSSIDGLLRALKEKLAQN